MSQPWWYSGDEAPLPPSDSGETGEGESRGSSANAPSMDWDALLAGAQRVVDWATDKVLAPHSEHDDPRQHPDCVVCRTLVLTGRLDGGVPRPSSDPTSNVTTEHAADVGPHWPSGQPSDAITWIPIADDLDGSRS